jgi:tripartite-type tricarboxylate transporter receptor subunit TctC
MSIFEPIGMIVVPPIVIAAKEGFSRKGSQGVHAYARANPDKLNMAHAGVGSITHFTGLMLNAMLGIKPALVAFQRSAPAINALVAGQVDYICDPTPDIVQPAARRDAQGLCGRQRRTRSPVLPDAPTTIEAGLPEVSGDRVVRSVCSKRHAEADPRQALGARSILHWIMERA